MNGRGQVVTRQFVTVLFPDGDPAVPLPTAQDDLSFLDATGLRTGGINPGPVEVTDRMQDLVPAAVDAAKRSVELTRDSHLAEVTERIASWSERAHRWRARYEQLELVGAERSKVRRLSDRVALEEQIAESLHPDQQLVRPLLLIVPTVEEN